MSYKLILTDKFKRQAKRLLKKYHSLKLELAELESILILNPFYGINLGNNTYKVKLSVKSKGKGKGGGVRIITFVVKEALEIYMLTIFDKSEFENVVDDTIQDLISSIKPK